MKVVIAPYDPNWPILFEQEKARLEGALGDHVLDIQHIGSTSVPGLGAKPIIDIMIAVRSLEEADEFCIRPIVEMGYEYVKEFERETPMRRYFRKSNEAGVRTH
ncbi:MAG: GrpB family protein, partial [Chloroflexota bacterium]